MKYLLPLLLLFSFNIVAAELQLPNLSSPVMDLAGLMSETDKKDLSDLAYEIYAHNGPQITVLTVPDLQGYPIEEFSIRVAEKWQLGTKEKDNGLLVVISKQEREMRIEVGNGIEGEVTDYDTAKYTREIFPEYFRQGDFHGALRIFMQDMAAKFNIQLEQNSQFIRRAPPKARGGGMGNIFIIGIIATLILGSSLFRNRPFARGLFTAAGFSGVSFMMGLPIILLIFIFIFGLVLGLMGIGNFLASVAANSGGRYRGGGGGFGGGGGGWSGGGGGFSGGGSSGRW